MVASRTSDRGFQNIVEHRPIGETRKVIVERRSRRDFSNPLGLEARLAFSVEFSDESFNFVDRFHGAQPEILIDKTHASAPIFLHSSCSSWIASPKCSAAPVANPSASAHIERWE